MAARVYSFKSSGEPKSSQQERDSQRVSRPPIGIKTPLELSEGDDGFLKMHNDLELTIADNLKNLLLTNHGDRLFDYSFGANLKELTFELCTEEADEEATRRIQQAVSRYMPYIVLDTFEPMMMDPAASGQVSKIAIRISYSIPSINSKQRTVDVILYAVG